MKQTLKTFLILFTISITCVNSTFAQKKGETKLYNNVMAQGDTLSFNKFLAKYPNSVYVPKIQEAKAALIKSYNTTDYTIEEAVGIIKSIIEELQGATAGKDFIALPHKKDNVEYITAVIAPTTSNPTLLRVIKLKQENGNWHIAVEKTESRYIQDDALSLFAFVPQDNLSTYGSNGISQNQTIGKEVVVNGEKHLLFNYLNYTDNVDERSKLENKETELVSNLVSLADETVYSSMYKGEMVDGILNGACMDNTQGGMFAIKQVNYLIASFGKIPYLAPANRERDITKEAIKWWYEHNPKTKTTLEFGVLEKEHPIVQLFLQDKYKESSGNNTAAFFNIMETTVLCVYNKNTEQYLLVWCEPQVKDAKTEKELNTIYFEKSNTLVLYYYQGNRTFKERINLSTRQKR